MLLLLGLLLLVLFLVAAGGATMFVMYRKVLPGLLAGKSRAEIRRWRMTMVIYITLAAIPALVVVFVTR